MKQIIQNIKTGDTILAEIPAPVVLSNSVLIKTSLSMVSIGTEKMLVDFGKANIFNKAKQQPERVKQVFNKIKTEGFRSTISSVLNKLDEPIQLGYCNVGTVVQVGSEVENISIGDRVASNGPHAEFVNVPHNLVAKIPDNVTDYEALFTVIGAIGLQGIRLLNPALGENIVVVGLGLIGIITCQLLRSNGCNVIGVDIDQSKCDFAKSYGVKAINSKINSPVKSVMNITNELGADGVLITASTSSNNVISNAAKMSRKKGKIVLIGVVGLNIDRSDFYKKELSFITSCSYGPGRYDIEYEKRGKDYPISYVRWTAKRNFEAILSLLKNKKINVNDLKRKKVPLENFDQIYGSLNKENLVIQILTYPKINQNDHQVNTISIRPKNFNFNESLIGIIGAGNFTKMTIMPILRKLNSKIKYICSESGLNGTRLCEKYNVQKSTTNYKEILNDEKINTVIIATRHSLHYEMIISALKANKNIFVEKPLCITKNQLKEIIKVYNHHSDCSIMVGYNRRFSIHLQRVKKSIGDNVGAKNIIINMNAGSLPDTHWTRDYKNEGGRIIGEACHLFDLSIYLTDSLIKSVCSNSLGGLKDANTDNMSILLKMEDGSNIVINYFSNGSRKYSKERIEVFSLERNWIIENFIETKSYGAKNFPKTKTKIDKGHYNQFKEYFNNIENGRGSPIPIEQIVNVSLATFAAIKSLKESKWINIKEV